MAYTAPRTWVAGDVLTAGQLNEQLRDNLLAAFPLGVGAWTAYTPTLTNITVGNGAQQARYQRVGRIILLMWDLSFGSTTAFTGPIAVGLPVAAAATGRWNGSAYLLDAGTQEYGGFARITSAGTTVTVTPTAGGTVAAAVPFTWAVNDRLSLSITYEAAA